MEIFLWKQNCKEQNYNLQKIHWVYVMHILQVSLQYF